MNVRPLLVAMLAMPTLLAAAPAPTPSPIGDAALEAGSTLVLPSIVVVLQNVSGALHDNRDNATRGPFFGAYAGTGFFVASDGYLVTAAHVAAPTQDLVKAELVDFDIDQTFKCNVEKSADRCQGLEQQHHAEFAAATTVVNPNIDLRVLTQDLQPSSDGISAQVVASSPTSEQDIAIIKVTAHDAPVSLLGESNQLAKGTPLAVIGYPASGQTPAPTLVPTITSGRVIDSRRGDLVGQIAGSADLLQIDAHTEHGSSGGPGVQTDGLVAGIVSFGDTSNRNFLVAAGDVTALLATTPARNQLGRIDRYYRQALDSARHDDFARARQLFDQCARLNPLQIYCRNGALDAGRSPGIPENAGQPPAAPVGVAASWWERGLWAILGLLVGSLATALALRRQRPPARAHPGRLTSSAAYGLAPWAFAPPAYGAAPALPPASPGVRQGTESEPTEALLPSSPGPGWTDQAHPGMPMAGPALPATIPGARPMPI